MTTDRLFCAPVAGLVPVHVDHANDLVERWGHNLGPCERPFHQEAWVLDVDGRSVAAAVSASTVSASTVSAHVRNAKTGETLERGEIVELARLCADPAERWATRPMLRLWREVAAQRWSGWPVAAAVAYSQNRRHDGDMYRWDGWSLWNEDSGSSGGGTWTKGRGADDEVSGRKRLWVWKF
jgi:hypothetical protein